MRKENSATKSDQYYFWLDGVQVFICERANVKKEFYLAIVLDRSTRGPMLVASSEGGMDIESVAKKTPSAIQKIPVDIMKGLTSETATDLARKLGFSSGAVEEASKAIMNLYKVFVEKDCTQVEINPMIETKEGKGTSSCYRFKPSPVLCVDAKLNFDDNADFRQQDIFSQRDTSQEDPGEVRAAQHSLNYIALDGDIGCLVNGAGLAMAVLDATTLHVWPQPFDAVTSKKSQKGKPANFLDVGGGVTEERVEVAFDIIRSDPKVKVILVNIFGGTKRVLRWII